MKKTADRTHVAEAPTRKMTDRVYYHPTVTLHGSNMRQRRRKHFLSCVGIHNIVGEIGFSYSM